MSMIQHETAVAAKSNVDFDNQDQAPAAAPDTDGEVAVVEGDVKGEVEIDPNAPAEDHSDAQFGQGSGYLSDDDYYAGGYGGGYSGRYASREVSAKDIKPSEVPVNVVVPYVMASGSGQEYDPEKHSAIAWQDVPGFQKFFDMISTMRPMGSSTERGFVEKYILSIEGMQQDDKGNCYICIGEPKPKVMWSCHTDTVHGRHGDQRLEITFDHFLRLPRDTRASCLGADDTAGCWIMLEMIAANVPGLYVFHWGEECGRIGSEWIVSQNPEFVKDIQACIAFDRKGYYDVITHQCGQRCCSQAFVDSIVTMLPEGYKADDGGSFTDSYSYRYLIPECTNLSVGYFGAHSSSESINLYALWLLREAMVAFDVEKVVIARDPNQRPFVHGRGGRNSGLYGGYRSGSGGSAYGRYGLLDESEDEGDDHDGSWSSSRRRTSKRGHAARVDDLFPPNIDSPAPETMAELFEAVGDEATEVLLDYYGIEVADLWEMIMERRKQ
ncbi:hypothetical protein PUR29_34880 [Methylobacterium ajmalii]|uniref:Peptidase M28 domain-containing protein n=1 Tax=Methylobacterium ajmalii TaxID=2738439 RepID=A0ABV0A4U2_9HYPH